MESFPKKAVQLGRFAPYHKKHHTITQKIVERHGPEKCLIMIGSSTSFNERTPFTFDQRRGMIQTVLGDKVEIYGLPDMNPDRTIANEDTFPAWRKNLMEIAAGRQTQFKFYGGSEEDLCCFHPDFETEVIVDRHEAGKGVSATMVRELLKNEDRDALKDVMDERIIEDAIRFFHENMALLGIDLGHLSGSVK